MDAFLFSIAPNDLESLMLDAENMRDIEQAPYKQDQIDLGELWPVLAKILSQQSSANLNLHDLIYAEYPISEHPKIKSVARYNPAVHVMELTQALEQISVEELQKYCRKHQHTSEIAQLMGDHTAQLDEAELTLLLTQLKSFYRNAVEQNHAVVSLIAENIRPKHLI
ncbi:DUF1877 family protein [Acinetobacter zhairhuonensis]|jgi:hypothetical protein|uniref:DUF1877 family protein n=1 Tax=Acinetobacter sp. A7.4 TaxID=2919921 RepID=UPI001F4E777A|nr:DUF1877 family protein [Acinetobacter sp. A7.4]MCJ8160884.1 YfbM family protein [Acinetobacter sp. A7.4]